MVWCGERYGTHAEQAVLLAQLAGHAVDLGGLQRLIDAERRQDRGQALGEHGLARAGRPMRMMLCPPAAAISKAV
jgi:hypothetical protein